MGIFKSKTSKLQFKFTLEFALFFVALAVVIFYYFSNKFKEETFEHFSFKAEVISSFLEQNPEIFWRKQLIGKENLQELMKLNGAHYVVIEDNKGELIDAINLNYAESNLYVTTQSSEDLSADNSIHRVTMPIYANKLQIGNVYVGFKSKLIATELKRKTLLTALFSISILLAGIIFTYFLSAISFKPLHKIISMLDKKVGNDNYSELQYSKKNEISILTEKVDAVVAELDQSSMQVEKLKNKLNEVFHERMIEIDNEINQRKKAETFLKKSEKQFKLLFENAPIGMILASNRGTILNVNNIFCKTLGYRFEEIVGKSLKTIFTDNESINFKPLHSLIQDSLSVDSQTILVKKDGTNIYAIIKSVAVTDEKGNPVHSLIQILDITDIRKVQTDLTIALEKAKEADRLKSAFLSQMSHEIRTPLNVILPAIPIIADELSSKNEDVISILSAIENAGNRLQRTIDMILSMSAVQSGNYKPKFETFNLAEDIKNLTEEFKTVTSEKGLELIFENNVSVSEIVADRYTTNQIFQNLIGNAVKYTHQGHIKVSISDYPNNRTIIRVEDTGIGMASKYLKNLFSPFSQEDSGHKRKYEGNGLGLALVKEYVDVNKGKIDVKSEKGKGSVFSVIFERRKLVAPPENKVHQLEEVNL